MARIGIVEDNVDFRTEVSFHMRRAGYEVALESDGPGIDQQLERHPCDLLVLDLGLPGEDGLVIAQRLRRTRPHLGIVMLTARGSVNDRLAGLEGGADAYLSKPVDMRELVAVIATVLRRLERATAGTGIARTGGHAPAPERPWTLYPARLLLVAPSRRSIPLTANEATLLRCLVRPGGDPVARRDLVAAVGSGDLEYDERRLEVAFSRLRLKIEAIEPDSRVILSARGRGYLFGAALRVDEAR